MPTGKVKINGVWYNIGTGMTQEEKDEMNGRFTLLESRITQTETQISLTVSKTTYDQGLIDNLNDAKAYANNLNGAVLQDISDMQSSLDNTNLYIDGAFKDGIIYEAEQRQIEAYLNTLAESKAHLDARYDQIYNDPLLVDSVESTAKADLATAKADYDAKYNTLVTDINTVIADTIVDDTEKTEVDTDFTTYRATIAALTTALETAVGFISQRKADIAQSNSSSYTDGLYGPLAERVSTAESKITQNATNIDLKVTKEDYNNTKMQENWYNFVKANNINMIGDLEKLAPPSPYLWDIKTLPDGTQGRVLVKKYTAGSMQDSSGWLMPEIKVDPSRPYLLEFWVKALDKNSAYYFGREEYSADVDGVLSDNDQGNGPYVIADAVATDITVGQWVKHFAVIPPHDAGLENDHTTQQSAYTPDYEYKFWNASSTYVKPKVYLTDGIADVTQDSEMHAWGFGLYEIGSKINVYKELEFLNLELSTAQSDISQNADAITLRVTTAQYSTDMTDVYNRINDIGNSVSYQVFINSTNGNIFYRGDITTTLEATVQKNGEDITDTIDASNFIWTRVSNDPTGDTSWNSLHASGTKSITVTDSDLLFRAMFRCAVTVV